MNIVPISLANHHKQTFGIKPVLETREQFLEYVGKKNSTLKTAKILEKNALVMCLGMMVVGLLSFLIKNKDGMTISSVFGAFGLGSALSGLGCMIKAAKMTQNIDKVKEAILS